MTQEEIIRMAREAGFTPNGSTTVLPMTDYASHGISYELERFATLVAAHERDKQAAQEPVAWMSENGLVITDEGAANCWVENGFTATPLYTIPNQPSNQKPIAWWNGGYDITMNSFEAGENWTPLYAAPVRTKDLSDDEIGVIIEQVRRVNPLHSKWDFARAVIAAYKEKNK